MNTAEKINNYANAMFRYETLHETWLNSCVSYLNYVFNNNEIHGHTVIDYAFGRGNWAVAFARCGAKQVIAIDASQDNCRKLNEYCKLNKITNIEVICGNLVEQNLNIKCDLLWLYGILHHIANTDCFLNKIVSKIKHDGIVLAYSYNANSFREWLVSTTRNFVLFKNEDDFRAHSLWFTPTAQMRARDDLVAPHINWNTATTFVNHFSRLDWHPIAQLQDFTPWLHGEYSGEFNPYVVKFSRQNSDLIVIPQEDNPGDLEILRNFSELILIKLPQSLRTSFVIGLFNTHFQNFPNNVHKEKSYKTKQQPIWEDFKYLMYAATMLSVAEEDFPPNMRTVWDAAMCSLKASPRKIEGDLLGTSLIMETLTNTNMRI